MRLQRSLVLLHRLAKEAAAPIEQLPRLAAAGAQGGSHWHRREGGYRAALSAAAGEAAIGGRGAALPRRCALLAL